MYLPYTRGSSPLVRSPPSREDWFLIVAHLPCWHVLTWYHCVWLLGGLLVVGGGWRLWLLGCGWFGGWFGLLLGLWLVEVGAARRPACGDGTSSDGARAFVVPRS